MCFMNLLWLNSSLNIWEFNWMSVLHRYYINVNMYHIFVRLIYVILLVGFRNFIEILLRSFNKWLVMFCIVSPGERMVRLCRWSFVDQATYCHVIYIYIYRYMYVYINTKYIHAQENLSNSNHHWTALISPFKGSGQFKELEILLQSYYVGNRLGPK